MPGTMTADDLLGQMRWRYAVKEFDPNRRIPAETWSALEHSLVLSASSFGLQPWKFIVVESPEVRQRLLPRSWGQRQIVEADKLVVFAARTKIDAAYVDRFIARTAEVRGATPESLAGYRGMMVGFVERPDFDARGWASRQAYLALGTFLTAAAALGIDACPMEGIDPLGYDEELGLAGSAHHTLMVAAAGYRSPSDRYAELAKVRFPISEVLERR